MPKETDATGINREEEPIYLVGQLWAVDDITPFGRVINTLLREESRNERFRLGSSNNENISFVIFDSRNPQSLEENSPVYPFSRYDKGYRFGFTTSTEIFNLMVENEVLVKSNDPFLYDLVLEFPVSAYLLDIKVRAGISPKKADGGKDKVILDFYLKQTRGTKLFFAFSPFTKKLFDTAT